MRLMMKQDHFRDRVVVVMGASSGIGRLTALEFARRGARVVVAARSDQPLESLVQEIERAGGQALALPADTGDHDQVRAVAEEVERRYGRLDTWVQMAAVAVYAPFDQTTPQEFRDIIQVDLVGQAYGAMAALPIMKRQGHGPSSITRAPRSATSRKDCLRSTIRRRSPMPSCACPGTPAVR
jgi:NAD(P)-dependent dehydrogenase (short-subunit alcohol dehydrogenase family)